MMSSLSFAVGLDADWRGKFLIQRNREASQCAVASILLQTSPCSAR
jgi:hypothetical protein